MIKTMKEIRKLTKDPQIFFEQKYADLVQLFWFGFTFSIVSPVCIIISTFGLFIYYVFERVLFKKTYAIPPYSGVRVSIAFINSLQFVALHIGLVNFFLYFVLYKLKEEPMDPRIFSISISNIVLGIWFLIMPWDQIIKKLNIHKKKKKKNENKTYQ